MCHHCEPNEYQMLHWNFLQRPRILHCNDKLMHDANRFRHLNQPCAPNCGVYAVADTSNHTLVFSWWHFQRLRQLKLSPQSSFTWTQVLIQTCFFQLCNHVDWIEWTIILIPRNTAITTLQPRHWTQSNLASLVVILWEVSLYISKSGICRSTSVTSAGIKSRGQMPAAIMHSKKTPIESKDQAELSRARSVSSLGALRRAHRPVLRLERGRSPPIVQSHCWWKDPYPTIDVVLILFISNSLCKGKWRMGGWENVWRIEQSKRAW